MVDDAYALAKCGNHLVSYNCDKSLGDPCVAKPGKGGTYGTLAQCHANCNVRFDCKNTQCVKAAPGTTGKYPNKMACDTACKAPPGPTPIPPCNATNYREFWCTTANDTESFPSLATKLHVHPYKLGDYNFLYDYGKGVKPGDSLRVPFDQCTPKVGVWNCYAVKAGDTLQSVAKCNPHSLIQGTGAVDKLKSYNLDILYNDDALYPGQQLRLPIHICFEDENSDCVTQSQHPEANRSPHLRGPREADEDR
jgi:hypothetical protein